MDSAHVATLSAWWPVVLAVPVLLLGEALVRRIRILSRFDIPAPVVGGLLVSLVILVANALGAWPSQFALKVSAKWWTWLVSTEPEWAGAPAKNVNLPFLVGFFTCIGLNASWDLARRGSWQVVLFLALATVLALVQNVVGAGLAKLLDVSPLLGVICGSVTLTGGIGTAMGFAADFENAGLSNAATAGMAAATFGLVVGGLIGGPVGGGLIRRWGLRSTASPATHLEDAGTRASGILQDLRELAGFGGGALAHFLLICFCIKAGSWVSYFIQQSGLTFPVYIGAMLVGLTLRNALDLAGVRVIQTEVVDTFASALLGLFLAVAMMSLNLIELANAAVPMLVILSAQVAVMAAFAWWVTFPFMGRDYDAAVMAGGHCGFGLGATPNAVANMKSLVERFGPAPRAFLVVPIVGAFLIDFTNALNITVFLNLLR
ncbi:MAG: sodium/glutamate symporter [Verrucomicrobia bacterium]|nr:sodium/glutamate symporter [Verrucomicrobiota bacterium]